MEIKTKMWKNHALARAVYASWLKNKGDKGQNILIAGEIGITLRAVEHYVAEFRRGVIPGYPSPDIQREPMIVPVPEPEPTAAARFVGDLERREARQRERKESFWQFMRDDFLSIVQAVPVPAFEPITLTRASKFDAETIVAVISDSHVGELIDADEIQGIGAYNFEIFRERLKYYYRSLLRLLEIHTKQTPCKRLVILALGDIVTGKTIFPGQAARVDLSIGEQVIAAVREFTWLFRQLAVLTRWQLDIYAVPGNHGRIGKKGEFCPTDNFDWIVGQQWRAELASLKNVTVNISDSLFAFPQIEGFTFYISHGDKLRGWMGIPYYAQNRAEGQLTRALNPHGVYPAYFIRGHQHRASFDGFNFINGGWTGVSEFSINNLHSAAPPQQILFGVHKHHGVTWRRAIDLIEPGKQARATVV